MSVAEIGDSSKERIMHRPHRENSERADTAMQELDVTLKRVQTMLGDEPTPFSRHREHVEDRLRTLMTWMIIAFALGAIVLSAVLVHVAGDVARYDYLVSRIEALERITTAYHPVPLPPKEGSVR